MVINTGYFEVELLDLGLSENEIQINGNKRKDILNWKISRGNLPLESQTFIIISSDSDKSFKRNMQQ